MITEITKHCEGKYCPFEYSCVDGCMYPETVKTGIPDVEEDVPWDGECLVCLVRKLGYKGRIDKFPHTCSLLSGL